MGMYTEIFVNVDLKKDTPPEIIHTLQAMCDKDHESPYLVDKPGRWPYLFNNGSFYLPLTECGNLTCDHIANHWSLLAKGDIKNYDDEIQKFFAWIAPYSDTQFLGYARYEEATLPTLYYLDSDGDLTTFDCGVAPGIGNFF